MPHLQSDLGMLPSSSVRAIALRLGNALPKTSGVLAIYDLIAWPLVKVLQPPCCSPIAYEDRVTRGGEYYRNLLLEHQTVSTLCVCVT